MKLLLYTCLKLSLITLFFKFSCYIIQFNLNYFCGLGYCQKLLTFPGLGDLEEDQAHQENMGYEQIALFMATL